MPNGFHGRALVVDLSTRSHSIETIPDEVFRKFLGGYGLGAWLMWKHFPPKTDALAPEACFAIVSGLLTGVKTPFSGRIQIVGKSPLTGTWADSNSGGSVAIQLRAAGYDAVIVRGRAETPTVLVVRDDEVRFDDAAEFWGQQVPDTFDRLKAKYGGRHEVGVSAIGPAGERQSVIASVMNDRYHAFGRQGFGAIYGSKNLKAIVVGGAGTVPIAQPEEFHRICKSITQEYRRDVGWMGRMMAWVGKTKKWLAWLYRLMPRIGAKIDPGTIAMRQIWSKQGTTSALAVSIENGDGPVKNWAGVGSRDFPLKTKSSKLDGPEVDKLITKKLSCGDCPMPCKGIVSVKSRGLSDVRRPDYETLAGFGANVLNDDLSIVVACHDACNRYGMDVVSASSTLAWAAEAFEKGLATADDFDGISPRWGDGEAMLALTLKMASGEGCGAWLGQGVARASKHLARGTEDFAVHVHGQEPAYHDARFSSLMGVTFVSDPTPGRHTAGSAAWNETFAMRFPLGKAAPKEETTVAWKGEHGKGKAQAHFSNAHQTLNGLGLCMFTNLTGQLPVTPLVNALTGWSIDETDLLRCGERIQNLRAAFNWREGIVPDDFKLHRRLLGEGDGLLTEGPLRGVHVPLASLRRDYHDAMGWNHATGRLSRARADALELTELLAEYVDAGAPAAPGSTA